MRQTDFFGSVDKSRAFSHLWSYMNQKYAIKENKDLKIVTNVRVHRLNRDSMEARMKL